MSYTVYELVAEQNGETVHQGINTIREQSFFDFPASSVDLAAGPVQLTWRAIEVDEVTSGE